MTTYCLKCPTCGTRSTAGDRDERICGPCLISRDAVVPLVRDYRAENVGVAIANLRREREHTVEEYAAKFLPTNADFASPSDPEGKKGMKKWREEHAPADSNKKPYYPGEVDKTTF